MAGDAAKSAASAAGDAAEAARTAAADAVAAARQAASPDAKPASTEAAAVNAERVKLYFDVGSEIPPTNAVEQLDPLIQKARSSSDLKLTLSGFHDKTGDPAVNADLARKRALAVRSVLLAAGLEENRIVMSAPAETTGAADDREARRVEVGVAP